MKNKPLISIIMNVYNGEKYLKESISSIINQTYKNWELIFWDNNSIDKSKKIFFEFKDRRLKYFFHKKKLSLYQSRNLALQKSKGKFVAFLDQDDFWVREKLSKQIKLFKNKNVGLVYSNYYKFNEDKIFFKKKLMSSKILPQGKITNYLLKNYVVGMATIIVRKKFLINKKVFNPKYNMLSDYIFVLNFSKNYKFKCVQEPLAFYRYHNNQMSKKYYSLSVMQHLRWITSKKEISEFKKYSNFQFIVHKIKFMKINDLINKGQRLIAIKEIYQFPFNKDKLKLVLKFLLPQIIFSYFFGQLY